MAKPAIVLEEIRKSYPDARTGKPNLVLNDISFRADLGAVTVVMGQSGSGKSTLFQILIGERRPDSGKIGILGHQLDPTDPRSFDAVKTSFGILFQHGALFNAMTVHENIMFPIIEHRPQLSRDTVDEMAWIKLRQVRLNPDIFSLKKPPKLSGGERKRVALARALALDPKLVFYDEPSAGLDPIVSREIDNLIKKLVEVYRMAAVVVTHELKSAFTIADRMVLLKRAVPADGDDWQGAIVYEDGTPEDLRGSRRPYTVDFLGEYSRYDLCANLKCRSVEAKGSKTCTACGHLRVVRPLDAPPPTVAPQADAS